MRLGVVGRAHGIKGELRITLDHPASRSLLNAERLWLEAPGGPKEYPITHARAVSPGLLLSLGGVNDRDQAQALQGRAVYLREELLPPLEPGEVYLYQLEGLRAVSTSGEELGLVESTMETGANPVLIVRGQKGEYLLPLIDDVVRGIDLEAGTILIELLEGLEPS